MNKSRGKIHDYLGMIMDFSDPGIVTIQMEDYIRNILHHAPTDMNGNALTPAANHLFQIDPDAEPVSQDEQEIFVHMVMQLLYLSQ
jgi:hypothetical protein